MNRFLAGFVLLLAVAAALPQERDTAKRTRRILLKEHAGVARVQTPIEVSVRFERDAFEDPTAIRLFRVEDGRKVPVPCQVLDVTSHSATDSFAPAPQMFVQLAFLADAAANGTTSYEVALDGPRPPESAARLKVTGEDLGLRIDTGSAVFELHKPSGQLLAISPKQVNADRLVFQQSEKRPPLPIHWNPDIWPVGGRWGHTSDWDKGSAFDPARATTDAPPTEDKAAPFFYRAWRGPLLHRLTRWGRMPFVPQVDVSVTYTWHAGSPCVAVQSLMEFREGVSVHAVRNAELVFSRHQFDTAVWLTRDGKLHTAPAYDYKDVDRSMKEIARLAPDTSCLGLVNERKGYGVAHVTRSLTNLNKRTGHAADEGAHFYIRDYDEHGKGSRANFLYLVRPVVYREGYLPTAVAAGSLYAENSVVVVFALGKEPANRYDELLRWHKTLTNPLEVVVD